MRPQPNIPRQRAVRAALVLAAWFVGDASPVFAQTCDPPLARVVSAQGTIEVRSAGASDWQTVGRGRALCVGDTVRAGAHSRADLTLSDQSVIRLRANTEMTLNGVGEGEAHWVGLARGAAHFLARQGDGKLEVETPYTVAGVRGTEFLLAVEDGRTEVTVFEGRVLAANDAGSLMVTGGQSAVAEAGRAPVSRIVARPRDAVHWTLYYPPVLAPSTARAESESDPRFYTARASQRLAAGDVDEALADLARAKQLAPDDADALARAPSRSKVACCA